MNSSYGMVIVGSGEAGARAALELRASGWTGEIMMIGEERRMPYERPPLSKQVLLAEEEPSPVTVLDQTALDASSIRLLTGCQAVGIDRPSHTVTLSDGRTVRYERLLLATGASPRRLQLDGSDLSGVLYLRTFEDALALREAMRPGQRIAVIGGGFIGLEAAASAVMKGCSVTVVEAGPRILMRGVPEEAARAVEARHLAAGVQIRAGVKLERIAHDGGEQVIVLDGGEELRADAVLAGIGAVPNARLAASCGLEIDNGVKVDETLVTSDPDIFAAGDCCSFPHPLYDGRRIRLEAWRNAQDQGAHAARSMLGADDPYAVVPWFWSDQYELMLQIAGLPDSGCRMVLRDLGEAGKLYFHLAEDGRLTAVSGIGTAAIAKEVRLGELLIEKRITPDEAWLADPGNRLKALLRD